MTFQGHPRSLILAPIESTYGLPVVLNSNLIAISCGVSEILEFLYAESHFSAPNPYFGQNLGVFPLE